MKASHKNAESKYSDLRNIAYELTMEELPYQDKEAINLSEITHKALSFFTENQEKNGRKVFWDWDFGVRSYRKRYPSRFELAVWYNQSVCGLSIGRPSYNGSRVRLDFIERASGNNQLKGRLTPITVTAYEVYARLIDAKQVRIINPDDSLITYYTTFDYRYVKGTNTDMNPNYLYKDLEESAW